MMAEAYEVVEESPDGPSTFLVKHRPSGQFFQVQALSLEKLNGKSRKALIKQIENRVNLINPHLVQFYPPVQQQETVYLRREHCPGGNLQKFTKNLQKPLHETFLYRILYQTAFALKTIKAFMGPLDLKTVFLDQAYQVKLYNFSTDLPENNDVKMSQLGAVIFQLAVLKGFAKSSFEADLEATPYSETFKSLLTSMIKDPSQVKRRINKILCHPQVLLQSSQWSRQRCFMEKGPDTLEQREAALLIKERLLQKQERLLEQRELKLQSMERAVQGKLVQADAYLKRCKSAGSESSRSGSSAKNLAPGRAEEEPSYISCGDSDVFPTSSKLQVGKIAKPVGFARALSERRIRFKTSPLKDRNFIRKSLRQPRIVEEPKKGSLETARSRRSVLFPSNNCEKPQVGWTQEAKKHAFEMLRMLNSGGQENVKHTVL
ncbi:serine/threonine-protein kinase Nek6-like [Dendroctonus ponderosae]|uniref:serine/threonine-protein kinase Nek6-like n=1 Tax=Dendroctonus ponderosae TaxID=77166 RepID=UPI002035E1E8|nr:serine/threonine-protein kinase Nek6-like [Dendroctonus ponderosae]KAH1018290.1 hypothetical protein HUJ05_006091 [Dendroctonus ponderosae]